MKETQVVVALYRCDGCQGWWVSQEADVPEAHLLFHLAERHKDLFLWENYQGWHDGTGRAAVCPKCGEKVARPKFTLSQNGVDG
jgi:hypothetical protein